MWMRIYSIIVYIRCHEIRKSHLINKLNSDTVYPRGLYVSNRISLLPSTFSFFYTPSLPLLCFSVVCKFVPIKTPMCISFDKPTGISKAQLRLENFIPDQICINPTANVISTDNVGIKGHWGLQCATTQFRFFIHYCHPRVGRWKAPPK